jgi:tetratricopeptide (TPR) repeat protein
MERVPRDYETCAMLAASYQDGTLFDLDEIKWAFVRPEQPGDRGKAYAQGHWMVEYMDERFGPSALVRLLERYFRGEREEDAMPAALGVTRDEFLRGFLAWAGDQVKAWGLDPRPTVLELTDELRWADPDLAVVMAASQQARLDAIVRAMAERIGAPARPAERPLTADRWPALVRPPVAIGDATLAEWRREHPDHPDLLKEEIKRRIERGDDDAGTLIADLERLAALRPVDLFPHRKLAQIYLDGPAPEQAIPHLEELDVREEKTPIYARQLATLYRSTGDREAALRKITRAVSIDPYDASTRELAAAIAIEADRLDLARLHVKALTILEPDRPQHERRLARIEELLER